MNEELFANICDAVTLTALAVGLVYSVVTRRRRENKSRPEGGFSLLELMITVAIIAILAMIAIPRYRSFTAEARRGEANVNLKSIHTYQEAYMVAHNTYWKPVSTASLGVKYGFNAAATATPTWNCTAPGSSAQTVGGKTGKKLGWRFKSQAECEEMRYGYQIAASTGDFVALAHGGHNNQHWLYEQCIGQTTKVDVTASNCAIATDATRGITALRLTGTKDGDAICIGSEKPIQIIQDIVDNCK